jgi:alpha-mannosidase
VAITSVVRLLRGDAMVRVKTTIDNCVEDHILRVFFPTGIPAETVQAEMPFDVVTRSIKHPDTTGWREPYRPVQPQRAFVDIAAEGRGFALINAGNGQYEAVDSPQRELALTLLRCFRQWNSVRLAEYPDQNGPQCRGEHTFEYAVYPHRGDWVEGGVMRQSHLFNLPMRTAVGGPGNGDLPAERGFLEVASPDIEIAAVKKGEWDDSLVVRLVNTRDADVSTTLKVGLPVASAELCNMKETDIIASLDCSGGAIEIDVPAGKVLTLKLSLS